MKLFKYIFLLTIMICLMACESTSVKNTSSIIRNGIPWFDDRGNIVNAHGACIVKEGGRYYLFGEWKSNDSNAFSGFSCYSSENLVNWKFENVVLPMQKDGILGSNRVGERVKVMKCPSTGEFVMYMHADNMGYKDPHVGYATCKTIAGDYEFKGPLLYGGKPIRRWDMGIFKDSDGTGYLLVHHGIIYRLSDDYCSAEVKVLNKLPNSGESPAMFKKDGIYYMLYSGLTSWKKNDNFYFTAPSIKGPWTRQGFFAPKGTLTYNSQTTFVFPLIKGNDTIPMFMGDRWSYPHQASAATYVWMPMQVDEEKLSIPEYWDAWDVNTILKVDPMDGTEKIAHTKFKFDNGSEWEKQNSQFASNQKGSRMIVPFKGRKVVITGETNPRGGYARIRILNKKKKEVYNSLVDFYSKTVDQGVRFISPELENDSYTLIIEVTGIIPEWFKKNGDRFGSSDCYVTVENVAVF